MRKFALALSAICAMSVVSAPAHAFNLVDWILDTFAQYQCDRYGFTQDKTYSCLK